MIRYHNVLGKIKYMNSTSNDEKLVEKYNLISSKKKTSQEIILVRNLDFSTQLIWKNIFKTIKIQIR